MEDSHDVGVVALSSFFLKEAHLSRRMDRFFCGVADRLLFVLEAHKVSPDSAARLSVVLEELRIAT
jgi:hypothetical protein